MLNWIKKLFTRSLENPAVPLNSPGAYTYLGSPRSSSGVAVDRHTVLGYPAVYRAVKLISDKIGRLHLTVYKKNKDGGRTEDVEHPAWWLLKKRPNEYNTTFSFRSCMQAQALLAGNSFAYIFRDANAVPIEMTVLNPDSTYPVWAGNSLYYVTRINNTDRKLLPENVIHIRGLCTSNPLVGESVVDVLREAFGLGMAAQRYGSTFYRNNASPGPTILKTSMSYKNNEDAIRRLRENWSKMHEGLDHSHKTAILTDGLDLVPFSVNMEQYQFLQTREFEAKQIASIFGIPCHLINCDNQTSYGSLEAEEKALLSHCIDAWLVQWEQELESKLLKDSQHVRDSHYIEFSRLALEQTDVATMTTALIAELNNGGLSLNEYRAMKNRASIGPDGDRLRMPTGVGFLDDDAPEDEPDTNQPGLDDVPTGPGDPAPAPADTSGDATDQGRALLASVLRRYLTRLRKAAEAASRRADWQEWTQDGLSEHHGILADSIAPVCTDAAEVARKLLDSLGEELRAVLPEQLDKVFQRIDVNDWTRRILA